MLFSSTMQITQNILLYPFTWTQYFNGDI